MLQRLPVVSASRVRGPSGDRVVWKLSDLEKQASALQHLQSASQLLCPLKRNHRSYSTMKRLLQSVDVSWEALLVELEGLGHCGFRDEHVASPADDAGGRWGLAEKPTQVMLMMLAGVGGVRKD